MSRIVCPVCKKVHANVDDGRCPVHKLCSPYTYDFANSDEFLNLETLRVREERSELGLDGLVGGLEAVIINVETDYLLSATEELIKTTGYIFTEAFENSEFSTCVLTLADSADILIRSRKKAENPFSSFNYFPKSLHLPNTRLETFVFTCSDLRSYYRIQKMRGIEFLSDEILENEKYLFLSSKPSQYTGISVGLIEWKDEKDSYLSRGDQNLNWQLIKPDVEYLDNIGILDHTATRVRARDRDKAIIEFLNLTNYNFDFAIYVELFNSITNVARLSADDFAMVFTSGISPFIDEEHSGPTEKFIRNYGTRVHHMAFRTENIENTYNALVENRQEFLIELVGSVDQGLKQTFTAASSNTMIVNEYIHRYGDFDGFFTKDNVTLLTGSTDKQ